MIMHPQNMLFVHLVYPGYTLQVDGDYEDWLEVLRLMYYSGERVRII